MLGATRPRQTHLRASLRVMAPTRLTVVLVGQTGTGRARRATRSWAGTRSSPAASRASPSDAGFVTPPSTPTTSPSSRAIPRWESTKTRGIRRPSTVLRVVDTPGTCDSGALLEDNLRHISAFLRGEERVDESTADDDDDDDGAEAERATRVARAGSGPPRRRDSRRRRPSLWSGSCSAWARASEALRGHLHQGRRALPADDVRVDEIARIRSADAPSAPRAHGPPRARHPADPRGERPARRFIQGRHRARAVAHSCPRTSVKQHRGRRGGDSENQATTTRRR